MNSVALRHVGSSRTRDWIHLFCIGRWILYHWTTWEALIYVLLVSNCEWCGEKPLFLFYLKSGSSTATLLSNPWLFPPIQFLATCIPSEGNILSVTLKCYFLEEQFCEDRPKHWTKIQKMLVLFLIMSPFHSVTSPSHFSQNPQFFLLKWESRAIWSLRPLQASVPHDSIYKSGLTLKI